VTNIEAAHAIAAILRADPPLTPADEMLKVLAVLEELRKP
jgi:hypothetical protein